MATTRIQVYNYALGHLGHSTRISATDEGSAAANALNLVYDDAVDELLRDFDWPFAMKVRALGLVTEKGDDGHADDNYDYAYRYPSDCLKARRIQSGVRTDYRSSRVTYDLRADDQSQLIVTDRVDAILEFTTTDARQPGRWHSDFTFSLSYRLAAYAAPMITKGDPFKLGQIAMAFFRMSNAKAMANAANEVQPDEEPDASLILARI
jgi:hypothetical protein